MIYGENIKYDTYLYSNEYLNICQKFDCGNEEINTYLYRDAEKDLLQGLKVTKLILNENKTEVIAYFTLVCSAIMINTGENVELSPAVEIKLFAVNKNYQDIFYTSDKNDGIFSDYLLSETIQNIYEVIEKYCGAIYIVLYSVPKAVKFYKRNEFKNFSNVMVRSRERYLNYCTPMFLPL